MAGKPLAVDPMTMRPTPDLPERVDGRGLAARAFRRGLAELHVDLGGAEHLSWAERALCRRATAFELWLGSIDARAQRGEDVTAYLPHYAQVTNSLLGVLRTLGIKRRAKPVQTLAEIMASPPPDEPITPEVTAPQAQEEIK